MTLMASRRDVIKGTLRAGAYAAPVIVGAATPILAAAQVSGPGIQLIVTPSNPVPGSLLSIAGAALTPNTQYQVRQISGANGVVGVTYATFTTSATGTFATSIRFTTMNPVFGNYVYGIAPTGSTNYVRTLSVTFMSGALPTTPVLRATLTSGGAGVNFALLAQGLTDGSGYDIRLTAAPMGVTTGVIANGANLVAANSGQIPFAFLTSGFPNGTYTLAVVPTGTMTVLAQINLTLTGVAASVSGGSITPAVQITSPNGPAVGATS